jgi:hypothetical protein
VELLLVAFLLAVGLLGLGALQVAVVRARAACGDRAAAAGLGNGVLESALAEARAALLAGRSADPAPTEWRKYTDPEASRWVERFGPDGAPGCAVPRFTVTLTRDDPAGPASGEVQARTFQATVSWGEAGARNLVLTRIISY